MCKSGTLGQEIARLSSPEASQTFDCAGQIDAVAWLSDCLRSQTVSAVFFESCFFTDTAPYRAISPSTRFIAITPPEDQDTARAAMAHGACAVLQKPITSDDVRGVLTLVSA
ncbi:MAG TPA: hypothetical protein PKO22_02360 [Treponemataceae bacterium]|nr:hypothetical protein [Treponemataceae bacterium]